MCSCSLISMTYTNKVLLLRWRQHSIDFRSFARISDSMRRPRSVMRGLRAMRLALMLYRSVSACGLHMRVLFLLVAAWLFRLCAV